mgnify:CR=1 FL=1
MSSCCYSIHFISLISVFKCPSRQYSPFCFFRQTSKSPNGSRECSACRWLPKSVRCHSSRIISGASPAMPFSRVSSPFPQLHLSFIFQPQPCYLSHSHSPHRHPHLAFRSQLPGLHHTNLPYGPKAHHHVARCQHRRDKNKYPTTLPHLCQHRCGIYTYSKTSSIPFSWNSSSSAFLPQGL